LGIVVNALEFLGGTAGDMESHVEAIRLWGAASALRTQTGYKLRMPHDAAQHDADMTTARVALGDAAFDDAWAEGAAMSWKDAVDYASRGRGERKRPSTGWASLTPMERKVVALVVEGLTNPQIGERLFVSRHTVDTHLRHVFAKVGVSTRSELAVQASKRAELQSR